MVTYLFLISTIIINVYCKSRRYYKLLYTDFHCTNYSMGETFNKMFVGFNSGNSNVDFYMSLEVIK